MPDSNATSNSRRAAAERGRDWERRRVLDILDRWEYAASISPNGEITENAIAAIKREVSGQ